MICTDANEMICIDADEMICTGADEMICTGADEMICIGSTLANYKHMILNGSESNQRIYFLGEDCVENPALMVLPPLSRTKVPEVVDATGIFNFWN